MKNNVEFYNGCPVVSSRKVARDFERRHAYILNRIDIELKHAEENNLSVHFFKRTYIEPQNKQEYREYVMTREGFDIITLKIRGKKAADIRAEYLKAFTEAQNNPVENIIDKERQTKMETTNIITIENVRGYIDKNGTAWLDAEAVARGWGFTTVATSGNEVVRWNRVNAYLREFKFIAASGNDIKAGDFLPENIVYRLGFKAKNKRAQDFQAKLSDEILPSIRKTGSYNVLDTPSYQISDPIERAEKWIEEEKVRQALCIENTELKKKNVELDTSLEEEKVFRDTVFETGPLLTWTKAARLIGQKVKIGRQGMLARLKIDGIIDKDNLPCARYIQSGHLDVKQRRIFLKDGSEIIKSQGFVTQKGLEWLIKRFSRLTKEKAI
nr:MAG TPA: regulatory protein [Caudoviricetes sp.]